MADAKRGSAARDKQSAEAAEKKAEAERKAAEAAERLQPQGRPTPSMELQRPLPPHAATSALSPPHDTERRPINPSIHPTAAVGAQWTKCRRPGP